MNSRFTVEAEADINEAFAWYERKGQGLCDEFVRCLDACVAKIERNPLLYPVEHRKMRRALVRRFPYEVLYEIEEDEIVVYAVYHCARDPKGWKRRPGNA